MFPDTDGDGVCDVLDDCPLVADALQSARDADGVGDAWDCLIDGSATGPLPKVAGLRVTLPAPGARFLRRLTWADERDATLTGATYEALTGSLDELHASRSFTAATCLAGHLTSATAYEAFASGSLWYLVRLRDDCAPGTAGASSSQAGANARAWLDTTLTEACP